jgi:hypothetical protein
MKHRPYSKYRSYSGERDSSRGTDPSTDNKKRESHTKRVEFDIARKLNDSRDINGDIKCFECGRVGHYMRDCSERATRSKMRYNHRSNALIAHSDDYDSLSDSENLIYHKVFVNGQEIECIVDCGSELSLTDLDLTKRLGLKLGKYTGKPIKAVNGSPVEVAGQVDMIVVLKHEGEQKETKLSPAVIKNFDFKSLNVNVVPQHPPNSNNRIHLLHDVTLEPNKSVIARVRPSFRKQKKNFSCVIKTNPNLFKRNKIYLKESEVEFQRGEAQIPIINCKSERVKLSCGTIIGNFETGETMP